MSLFKGSAVALVTPFKEEEIDFNALTRLIELQCISGTDAIVVCGTTGEASTLSGEEKKELIRFAVERVDGRIPVIAGTGGNNTSAVIEDSRTAEALGCDGLLLVSPFYNKTSQEGLVAHFSAVAEQVKIPIILYNIPSRTGLNILPETVKKIKEYNENVIGIKEASANIDQIAELASICPDIDIYSGNDNEILPILSLGGKGVISTVANIVPSEVHNLCMAFFAGKINIARQMQFDMLPLIKAAFCETNPIPIKNMMEAMNLCSGELRLPLIQPSKEHKEYIVKTLKDYKLVTD